MKFLAETLTKCAPRLGVLKDLENKPQFVLDTPLAMLYTRGGSIPHITHEVYQICCKDPQIIQIPLASTYHYCETLADYGGTLAEFVGLKNCITWITVQDPADLTQSGHRYKDHIPLWLRSGKVLLGSDKYMDTIEVFKPDVYCLLSDSDTNVASGTKRVGKAVDNTLNFFEKCMERHEKSDVLSKSFIIASLAGGYCLKSRQRCIDGITKNDSVGGYLIDGLSNNGPEIEFLPFSEVKPVIEYVVNKLPSEKLRVVQGCWNPVSILRLVQLGIDLFDTSYCHIVTERSSALTFALDSSYKTQTYEINLRQPQYADDFQSILQGCSCLTCSKHSRAYVYHLLTVQELLGPLLLSIHNIHHFMKFFEKIRSSIKEGSLDSLEELICKQFEQHQREILQTKEINNISSEN